MKQTNFLSLLFFLAILPLAIYFQRYLLNKSTFSEPKLGFEPGLIRTKEKEDNGTDFPGANPLQYQYPNNITGTYNATFFLIDFPRNVLGDLLPKGRELLPLTEIRKTLPHQKNGTSPLLVRIGLDEDVHSGSVVAGSNFDFHNAHVSIPFVDQSKDMKTGFIYDLFLATSSASSINLTLQYSQEKATLADFYPSSQAFIQIPKVSPSSSSSYFASAKGHNSSSPIYELQYSEISSKEQQSSSISMDSVKTVVNQGQFQLGNCTYDDQMWNLPFSNPHVIRADYLNLYYPFVPKALAGIYDNVYGVRVPQGGFIERVNSVCQSEA